MTTSDEDGDDHGNNDNVDDNNNNNNHNNNKNSGWGTPPVPELCAHIRQFQDTTKTRKLEANFHMFELSALLPSTRAPIPSITGQDSEMHHRML